MRFSNLCFWTFSGMALQFTVVNSHGIISGIVVDGVYYQGYNPSMQYQKPPPVLGAWSTPQDQSTGPIMSDQTTLSSPDVICHVGATPGNASIPVKSGAQIALQWTPWPDSHHGPMLDYLAPCNGPCESVDKTQLQFFKIDAVGLVDDSSPPGTWGSDLLVKNNNTWTVAVPTGIKKGNYVLRHETIALHQAGSEGQAQLYPLCFNLAIDSDGTDEPTGVKGQELYKSGDPGLKINIYTSLSTYEMPGPTPYAGALALSQTMPVAPVATGTLVPGI